MTKRLGIKEKRLQDAQKKQEQEQQKAKAPQPGQGVKAYTGSLKEDSRNIKPSYTKITLKVTDDVAHLLDQVVNRKKLRGEIKEKQELVSSILAPYLEAESERLDQLDLQDLQAKFAARKS